MLRDQRALGQTASGDRSPPPAARRSRRYRMASTPTGRATARLRERQQAWTHDHRTAPRPDAPTRSRRGSRLRCRPSLQSANPAARIPDIERFDRRLVERKCLAIVGSNTPSEETTGFAAASIGERWDSNPRPPGPQPGALPTELRPPRAAQSSIARHRVRTSSTKDPESGHREATAPARAPGSQQPRFGTRDRGARQPTSSLGSRPFRIVKTNPLPIVSRSLIATSSTVPA